MKAWYSKVRDTELKDGSVRATYVVTFETDNAELKREVEKYLQGIMDRADRKTEPTHDLRTETHECVKDTHDKIEPNSSEKPNNCEAKNYCDDCLYTDTCDSKEFFYACTSKATISKMEQVDEPQTCDNCKLKDSTKWCNNQVVCRAYKPKDEPQTDCPWK